MSKPPYVKYIAESPAVVLGHINTNIFPRHMYNPDDTPPDEEDRYLFFIARWPEAKNNWGLLMLPVSGVRRVFEDGEWPLSVLSEEQLDGVIENTEEWLVGDNSSSYGPLMWMQVNVALDRLKGFRDGSN